MFTLILCICRWSWQVRQGKRKFQQQLQRTPVTEIARFSRTSHITVLTIGNPLHEIDRTSLFNIDKGTCDKRIHFEIVLGNYETATIDSYVDKITRLDTALTQIYSGGSSFLLSCVETMLT